MNNIYGAALIIHQRKRPHIDLAIFLVLGNLVFLIVYIFLLWFDSGPFPFLCVDRPASDDLCTRPVCYSIRPGVNIRPRRHSIFPLCTVDEQSASFRVTEHYPHWIFISPHRS